MLERSVGVIVGTTLERTGAAADDVCIIRTFCDDWVCLVVKVEPS